MLILGDKSDEIEEKSATFFSEFWKHGQKFANPYISHT